MNETHWTEHEDECPCADCREIAATTANLESLDVSIDDVPTLVGMQVAGKTGDFDLAAEAEQFAAALVKYTKHDADCYCQLCMMIDEGIGSDED